MGELLVSFAVAMATAPLVMRVMRLRGILDIPNNRSSHVGAVPRGGGLACLAGILAGLALASARHHDVPWLAILGAVILAVVGFADDNRAVAAAPRLAAQLAVGALVGVTVGGGWWIAIGMICIPVAVNVVNFMDGINGITSLNLAAWGFVAIAVGYVYGEPSLMLIGAVTAGSTIAFLPWNAPVARLFLGDVGSYLLGGLVGIGIVIGAHHTRSLLILAAPLTIYLADTGTTILRRAIRHESLLTAHREHVYQRLVHETGMSHSIVASFTVILALSITVAWVPGSPILGSCMTLVVLATYLSSPAALAATDKSRRHQTKRSQLTSTERDGRDEDQTRTRPVAVVATTISRSVDSFYGQTIEEFQARGYQVHVVTSDGPEVSRLQQRADAVHILPMERTISLWLDICALWAWVRLLRRLKPEIVLAGTPKAALLSMVASRLNGVDRRAYFLQGLRLEGTSGNQRRILSAMEWLTSRNSQVIIAVSASLAVRYLELNLTAGRPIAVPHHGSSHGVDSEYFSPIGRESSFAQSLSLDPELPIVIFIGRLTADKGPDALIDALELLRRQGIGLQLLVLGAQDEADSSSYQARLDACPTTVRVVNHLLDVRPYIAAADFLVLPTRREGMPNVVLEAAAMGVPSVTTTATGAVDSLLDGETGILVPPDNPHALATAMSRLLTEPGLRQRMGESARSRAVKLFQPGDVARAIANISIGKRVAPLGQATFKGSAYG